MSGSAPLTLNTSVEAAMSHVCTDQLDGGVVVVAEPTGQDVFWL